MTNKQTNSWGEEFDKRFNKDTLVSAHTDWTPKAIKDFIRATLSKERTRTLAKVEEWAKENIIGDENATYPLLHHLQQLKDNLK